MSSLALLHPAGLFALLGTTPQCVAMTTNLPMHAHRDRRLPLVYSALVADADDADDADGADDGARAQTHKKMTDRFEIQFTCNRCDTRNEHSISRHAYARGTVLVKCPGCGAAHILADNLNWLEDDFSNIEEYMAKRGVDVLDVRTRGNLESDGARAAASAASAAAASEPPPSRLEGIDDEQALAIREAVRAHKRRQRESGD